MIACSHAHAISTTGKIGEESWMTAQMAAGVLIGAAVEEGEVGEESPGGGEGMRGRWGKMRHGFSARLTLLHSKSS